MDATPRLWRQPLCSRSAAEATATERSDSSARIADSRHNLACCVLCVVCCVAAGSSQPASFSARRPPVCPSVCLVGGRCRSFELATCSARFVALASPTRPCRRRQRQPCCLRTRDSAIRHSRLIARCAWAAARCARREPTVTAATGTTTTSPYACVCLAPRSPSQCCRQIFQCAGESL